MKKVNLSYKINFFEFEVTYNIAVTIVFAVGDQLCLGNAGPVAGFSQIKLTACSRKFLEQLE